MSEAEVPAAPAPAPVEALAEPQQPAPSAAVVNGIPEDAPVGDLVTSSALDVTAPIAAGPEIGDVTLLTKYDVDKRLDDLGVGHLPSVRVPKLEDKDLEIDRDYTTRLLSASGSFTSNVRDNILSHPVVVKNRIEPTTSAGHISAESRFVMRKGFDLGISSPGLRMMYDARIKELEEELDLERTARNKADKQRSEMQRDLAALADRLEETNESARCQGDVIRRREAEFQKLQRDLEESQSQNEAQQAVFRKKHQEVVNQLTEQLDQLHKFKQKLEKEKNQQKAELDELRGQIEHATKAKITSEKLGKQVDAQLSEASNKIVELQKELQDLASHKNRIQQENLELVRKLEDLGNLLEQSNKAKVVLTKQLEEVKLAVDDETTVRNKVLGDNRNLQALLEQLRDQLDEEQERRSDLQRQLTRANNEALVWRQKFESGEGGIRPEELDELKKKLSARILDGEAQLEAALAKAIGLEKAKNRSQMEIGALVAEVEKCQAINAQHEKRQRQFDRLTEEWKRKVSDLQIELDNVQKEARTNAAEAFKFKGQVEESHELVESLRRENKNLSDEIHELTDQINQCNQRALDQEKISKRFEQERDELQATLEEAEAALEQEEARVDRAMADVAAGKEELERRLAEKDEEFESVRKNHQRAIDAMQISLETEARSKVEALRIKKKLEQDINDLEMALDAVNKAKAETEKNFKKYQLQIRDLQQVIEDEQRNKHTMRDELAQSERRCALLTGENEELRAQIDVLEKTRKMVEGELHEVSERVAELTAANSSLAAAKKKLETDLHTLHSDFEEQVNEVRLAEDQTKKAMTDAARLAEELRQEQEHASQIDKLRKGLEAQVKELQVRLDEAEAAALHGGRKIIQKLEQRVKELEHELDAEQHRHAETQKSVRKQDRRVQEVLLQLDEEHKSQERMRDMVDKLQQKVKAYKKQIDEAEEIAAINLAKYRKMQHDLEESEARADLAENMLGQARTKTRFSSAVTETSTAPFPGVSIKTTTTTTRSHNNILTDAAAAKLESLN